MSADPVRYIVDENGQKREVVLSIDDYESLKKDLHDLAKVAERKTEETLFHEEIKINLEQDGLL